MKNTASEIMSALFNQGFAKSQFPGIPDKPQKLAKHGVPLGVTFPVGGQQILASQVLAICTSGGSYHPDAAMMPVVTVPSEGGEPQLTANQFIGTHRGLRMNEMRRLMAAPVFPPMNIPVDRFRERLERTIKKTFGHTPEILKNPVPEGLEAYRLLVFTQRPTENGLVPICIVNRVDWTRSIQKRGRKAQVQVPQALTVEAVFQGKGNLPSFELTPGEGDNNKFLRLMGDFLGLDHPYPNGNWLVGRTKEWIAAGSAGEFNALFGEAQRAVDLTAHRELASHVAIDEDAVEEIDEDEIDEIEEVEEEIAEIEEIEAVAEEAEAGEVPVGVAMAAAEPVPEMVTTEAAPAVEAVAQAADTAEEAETGEVPVGVAMAAAEPELVEISSQEGFPTEAVSEFLQNRGWSPDSADEKALELAELAETMTTPRSGYRILAGSYSEGFQEPHLTAMTGLSEGEPVVYLLPAKVAEAPEEITYQVLTLAEAKEQLEEADFLELMEDSMKALVAGTPLQIQAGSDGSITWGAVAKSLAATK